MKRKTCHLLSKTPEKDEILPLDLFFQKVKVLEDDTHIMRYILKCKDCSQLYFYEFYEQVDWEDGEDPQYRTFIPIKSVREGLDINKRNQIDLLYISPRLQIDWPKGKPQTITWVK